jgi:hypothetical protein
LNDFGELMFVENEAPDLKTHGKTDMKEPRPRHWKYGKNGRKRMAFAREGQSKALLRSFFW